jgi:flavin-binding protein dodecin
LPGITQLPSSAGAAAAGAIARFAGRLALTTGELGWVVGVRSQAVSAAVAEQRTVMKNALATRRITSPFKTPAAASVEVLSSLPSMQNPPGGQSVPSLQ